MNNTTNSIAYTIVQKLHQSRKYCVYKAKDNTTGKFVVLKVNERQWRNDPSCLQALREEGETGLRLNYPYIRKTIGLFEDDGALFLVSEYVEGETLDEIIAQTHFKISSELARKWTLQILEALIYAQQSGILHLNLNPANIIITSSQDIKIFGFGKDPQSWKYANPEDNKYHPVLFIAPEVFLGHKPFDFRADLYSVGVISYLLFCGQLPWYLDHRLSPSAQKNKTLDQIVINPHILGKLIPEWLFKILNKALMIEPSLRFNNAEEMHSAIISERDIPYVPCTIKSNIISSQKTSVEGTKVSSQVDSSTFTKPNLSATQDAKKEPSVKPATKSENQGQQIVITTDPSLHKMQKTLKIIAIISAGIVIYIIFKYAIIKGIQNAIKAKKESTMITQFSQEGTIPNQPLDLNAIEGDSTIIGSMEPYADPDEFPPHTVFIPSFYISPYEITMEQWAMVFPGYKLIDEEKDLPVTNVTFDEVIQFCNEKSVLDGLQPCYEYVDNYLACDFKASGYRLPTEAEWEFAAKEGKYDTEYMYSGSNKIEQVAWYVENSEGHSHPVGEKKSNKLKLYDMSGNVSEWVWDWYAPYSDNVLTSLTGPESGSVKVIRGGSWKDPANEVRITNRSYAKPYTKTNYIGFRVVRSK
jgi:formylglycine-generating enzyme required for sulfatase activity